MNPSSINRRQFIASSLAGGLVLTELVGCTSQEKSAKYRPHFVMVFDQNKCIGCGLCKQACSKTNHVPAGQLRMTLERQTPGPNEKGNRKYVRVSCQQCQDAPCVRVCPTGAACRDPNTGIVTMKTDKCVGCKYCIAACPYNVRFINSETKVAENCDFCLHSRLQQGDQPACVEACRHGALVFGDVNDPNSYVKKLLAVKDTARVRPQLGTEPSLHYVPMLKSGV